MPFPGKNKRDFVLRKKILRHGNVIIKEEKKYGKKQPFSCKKLFPLLMRSIYTWKKYTMI